VAGEEPAGHPALHPHLGELAEHGRDLSSPIITRQAIRRGTFTSGKDLETAIGIYIDGWNDRAHPFTWTKGR